MTVILKPHEVKEQSHEAEQERKRRLNFMGDEETRLVESINTLRTEETNEKDRIRESIAEFRNEVQIEINDLELKLSKRRKELAELMKPIEEVRKEADERNVKSKEREDAVTLREEKVIEAEKALNEREAEFIEDTVDRENSITEREEALDRREANIKKTEDELKRNTEALNIRWVEYHTTVDHKNRELTEHEVHLAAEEKANKTHSESLFEREDELNKGWRRLRDREGTLERNIKRLQ